MPPFALALVLLSTVLHAGWNLLARSRRTDQTFFLRAVTVVGGIGLGPVLWAEWRNASPFPAIVWMLLAITGIFQAFYFLGLARAYSSGDFTVVYPVARALPVLLLALVDVARGRVPSTWGWLGMFLVVAGCLLSPLQSPRAIRLDRYVNATGGWVLVTALAGVGYSVVDKLAAEQLAPGAGTAARYGLAEMLFTVPYLALLLALTGGASSPNPAPWPVRWRQSALAGLGIFAAYWLILWAYQLSTYVSYVVALRQLSIVFGVVAASLLFREPAPTLRISAAAIIALGVAAIGLAG